MAATIMHQGDLATIAGGVWSSDEKALEQLLAVMSRLSHIQANGADPNPDANVAERCAAELGGDARMISYDEAEYVEGRVY